MKNKPIIPFEIDPDHFSEMIKAFLQSYPWKYHEIMFLAKEAESKCKYLDLDNKNIKLLVGGELGFTDYKSFWDRYLEIEDIECGGKLIKNCVFESIKPSNTNAIYKTAEKQGLSYSLVVSKVGIKIELLIKTLRTDLRDKTKFNKKIFDEIKKFQSVLNKNLPNLVWDKLDNRVYSRIFMVISKRSLNNKVDLPRITIDEYDKILSDMADKTSKFYEAFNPIIEKLNIKEIEKKL